MTQSIEELQHASDTAAKALADAKEAAANVAHFKDSDGRPLTDPVAVNDAMLRATGIAMEARASELEWQGKSHDELQTALSQALLHEDFVGVALFAAALNAAKIIGA